MDTIEINRARPRVLLEDDGPTMAIVLAVNTSDTFGPATHIRIQIDPAQLTAFLADLAEAHRAVVGSFGRGR